MRDESTIRILYLMSIFFLVMWMGTEIFEAIERTTRWRKVDDFIYQHEHTMFTKKEGAAVTNRVCRLEKIHGIDCDTNE